MALLDCLTMSDEIAVLAEPYQISACPYFLIFLWRQPHNSSLNTRLSLLNFARRHRIIQTNGNLVVRFLNLLSKYNLPLHRTLQFQLDPIPNNWDPDMCQYVFAWECCYHEAFAGSWYQFYVEAVGDMEESQDKQDGCISHTERHIHLHIYYDYTAINKKIIIIAYIAMASDRIIPIPHNLRGTHLEETYQQLAKQKSELIQEKIDKNMEKQKHIIKIQQELEQRLRIKNEMIKNKLEKSAEAKKKSIDKIRQKVHVKEKFQSQKLTAHHKRQRMQVNKSWRESKKLAEWTNNRTMTKSNVLRDSKMQRRHQLQQEQQQQRDEVLLTQIKNSQQLPILINPTKNQQQSGPDRKMRKYSQYQVRKSIRTRSQQNVEVEQMNKSVSYADKIREEQNRREKEEINKFNWKLRRLEEARLKKQKMQQQKAKKIHEQLQFKKQKQVLSKKSQKRQKPHQRTLTQIAPSQLHRSPSAKQELFKKWEQENKLRQLQLFEMRLRKGEDYLSSMEDKSRRNKMSRHLEMSSIEKKLYIERKSLHELSNSHSKNSL